MQTGGRDEKAEMSWEAIAWRGWRLERRMGVERGRME
jgi:hypothetical protein